MNIKKRLVLDLENTKRFILNLFEGQFEIITQQ